MTQIPCPVVWLTGWGFTPSIFSPLMTQTDEQLHAAGVSTQHHTPDLLVAIAPRLTLADWADCLAAHLPSQCVIIGWSLGGMLALALAARHPDKVCALGLLATTARFVLTDSHPPAGLTNDTITDFNQGFARNPQAMLKRFLALQSLGDQQRRRTSQILGEHVISDPTKHYTALAQGLHLLAESDLRPLLSSITQPVRILHGQGDALMPVNGSHWLTEQLPHAGLTVFSDCGHALPVTQSARCATLLAGHLLDCIYSR